MKEETQNKGEGINNKFIILRLGIINGRRRDAGNRYERARLVFLVSFVINTAFVSTCSSKNEEKSHKLVWQGQNMNYRTQGKYNHRGRTAIKRQFDKRNSTRGVIS